MSAYEGSYKSLLQGVSQQIPRERLPGQVTAQDNMVSDLVTNIRRRPGAEMKYTLTNASANKNNILTWFTDIAGYKVHVILCTATGGVTLLDTNYAVLANLQSNYLIGTNSQIRATTVGDEFFLANTSQLPVVNLPGSGTLSNTKRGFIYIVAGAYSKQYEVNIKTNLINVTASVTTPNGTGTNDAANSTPEGIMTSLRTAILAAAPSLAKCVQDKGYLYIETNTDTTLSITSASGTSYIICSGDQYVKLESQLPSRLPVDANGIILKTGSISIPTYYQYNSTRVAWLECGDATSPTSLTNMPVSITRSSGVWVINSTAFEGRLAGDDTSNPTATFLKNGITAMSAFQGRLVLASGSTVSLSSSVLPRRFYRSTVTSVLAADCIHVQASGNSSAAYRHIVPFQKDLLLFSERYQALIPSGNVALTPSNATVVLTSQFGADMTSPPIPLGRTLMYPFPRSADFFGVLEMSPSTYVDSQYVSVDSTGHLPKYMAGRCRFSVSSSVANIVLFAPSNDTKALVVHEYTWSNDQKVQQAWHMWRFNHDIAAAYFSDNVVNILFVQNGVLVGASIDPRVGILTTGAARRPFFDLYWFGTITANSITLPAWVLAFDPAAAYNVKVCRSTGSRAGEPVGFTGSGSTLTTVRSQSSGDVAIGYSFRSSFSPTPPLMVDQNGVKINTNKMTLQRMVASTNNSAQYKVVVRDRSSEDTVEADDVGTLYYSSSELALSSALVAEESVGVIPCRTNANTTSILFYTEDTMELNLVGLEYVAKFNQRIRRR